MTPPGSNRSASVRQRLLNQSKAQGLDPNALFTRFGVERFLYRIAQSPFADRFVLKGAMLLEVWLDEAARPTRDLDLLGFGDLSVETLRRMFAVICDQPVEPDGVQFYADSVAVRPIRVQDEYGGQRVTLRGDLGTVRLYVQVDVGIGDALTPPAEWIVYPALLDLPRPYLRAYRPETTIAEKLHAMVTLDVGNSRMKDFFDLYRLAEFRRFEGETLSAAVRDTFARRSTAIPAAQPIALTAAFALHPGKKGQWAAFLKRSGLRSVPDSLEDVIEAIAAFLGPVLDALREERPLRSVWTPGGPWVAEPDVPVPEPAH